VAVSGVREVVILVSQRIDWALWFRSWWAPRIRSPGPTICTSNEEQQKTCSIFPSELIFWNQTAKFFWWSNYYRFIPCIMFIINIYIMPIILSI
jgi:hypothetical protein